VTGALATGLATVPGLTGTDAVTAEDAVNAALAAYNALSDGTKAQSSVDAIKDQLDDLKAAIDDRRVVLFDDLFTGEPLLATSPAAVDTSNKDAIQAAVNTALAAYNTLSPEAKLLSQAITDKAALDALQGAIDALTPVVTAITTASVTGLTAPVTGAAPDTTIAAGAASYTVQSITWKQGGTTHTGNFAASTSYTADIVLQAAAGYKFTAITPTTDAGTPAAGTISGDVAQNTLTFTVTFPATGSAPPAVTAITTASVTGLTAPVTGAAPDTTIAAGAASYTVQSITWKQGGTTHTGPFAASTTYTADIVLQAAAGYKFTAITPTTDAGTPAAGTISADSAQNTLTFTVTFPATGASAPVTGTPNVITAWVTGTTIAISPAATADIHRTPGDSTNASLVINVTESGISNIVWSVNGVPTGDTGTTFTFDATWKSDGPYNIGLSVTKGGKTYSTTITVTVGN
jgi:hypothetical protein